MSTTKRAPGSYDRNAEITHIEADWAENPRWKHITRTYSAADVVRLRGSLKCDNTIARRGAEKLWELIDNGGYPDKDFVNAMGALTGGQAVQQVKAGIQAIYLSGWQVAAGVNTSETLYPDQSLYADASVSTAVRCINNAFERADQIQWKAGKQPGDADYIDYFAPIVADAEAGFGGVLDAYELMKNMIRAGASGVHFADQLASVKKCGHMGGKVLVPTQEAVQKLIAARLAADVEDTPTLILARTDANTADLLTSDCDPYDKPFVIGDRTDEGFYRVKAGIDQAIARGLAYAPYADLLWCETARPDLAEAKKFAEAIRHEYPDQLLSYNCSPSFDWKKNLDDKTIAKFQRELSAMGYKFQFITLAGIHSMSNRVYEYVREDMSTYVRLQEQDFADTERSYAFIAHQQKVGTGYFDDMTTLIQGGKSSVTTL